MPVGRISSSYPSCGPSRSHGSDIAQVDTDQQAGPDPHVALADGKGGGNDLLVKIK